MSFCIAFLRMNRSTIQRLPSFSASHNLFDKQVVSFVFWVKESDEMKNWGILLQESMPVGTMQKKSRLEAGFDKLKSLVRLPFGGDMDGVPFS